MSYGLYRQLRYCVKIYVYSKYMFHMWGWDEEEIVLNTKRTRKVKLDRDENSDLTDLTDVIDRSK